MDNVVVIDPGSRALKAGFAFNYPSDDEPRVITPSLLHVKDAEQARLRQSSGSEDVHVADADENDDNLSELYPVRQGKIVNFEAFESLLFYVLYELLGWVHDEEAQVVIAEPLLTPKSDREHLAQVLFEVFNVSGLFLQDSAVLALYAVGKLSGCVVDVGDSKIDISSVSEGTANYAATRRLHFAGSSLTELLQKKLQETGQQLSHQEAEALKEQISKAAESVYEYDALKKNPPAAEKYTLPDGQQFSISSEGHMLGEALFRPGIFGVDQAGLAEAVAESIGLGPDRKLLHENILVCGGGSCITNFQARLVKEMRLVTAPSLQPALCHVPEYMPSRTCQYAPWIGGAVLAKVVLQQNHFVTKSDYEEFGPYAVHRKCN